MYFELISMNDKRYPDFPVYVQGVPSWAFTGEDFDDTAFSADYYFPRESASFGLAILKYAEKRWQTIDPCRPLLEDIDNTLNEIGIAAIVNRN